MARIRLRGFARQGRWAKGLPDPIIKFYWPLPPLAYLPLMIISLGMRLLERWLVPWKGRG